MSIRPPINQEATDKLNDRGEKLISRAYLIWLFGVGVGLIKLKANKVSFNGLEYTIENPEALQGIIFIACIFCYGHLEK